ncbi:MAG: protein kinase [Polyangiaceae bacterium]|nr:protein kinase [Polyangiaceae bacterium]
MIACPACHTPSPPGAAICLRCGAALPRARSATVPAQPLGAAPPSPAPPPAPPALAPTEPRDKGSTVDDPGLRGAPAGPHGTAIGLGLPGPPPDAPPQRIGPAQLLTGDVVDGKYRLESVLGEGGMGVVFLATELVTDAKVVVKALHAALASSEQYRARVRDEARALAQIDHPNVVRLNAVVSTDTSLLLVMQFVDGRSLDRIIASRFAEGLPFGAEEALSLFRQIALGVAAAHAEGVVHRDIKPANVLVRAKDGLVKVTDFGIAKSEDDAKAGRGVTQGIIGSLWYMAPEQVTGRRDLDKRVDVYSLGILLFELLIGRVPFDADSDYEIMKMHAEAPVPSVCAARPELPRELDALLARATAKDRELRYPSCEALLADVDALLVALRPEARPPTTRLAATGQLTTPTELEDAPRPRSRAPLLFGALVAATLVGGGATLALSGALDAPRPRASAVPVSTATASASASSPAASASAPRPTAEALTALAGRWVSDTGRHYDAVVAGGEVEFRVRDPEEFPRQNYLAGEARFTLKRAEGRGGYLVEDKIRPVPPAGLTYERESRGTCQETWSSVGGAPLLARLDGARLSVDLVKVTPERASFEVRGARITGCAKLDGSTAVKIDSTLTRD